MMSSILLFHLMRSLLLILLLQKVTTRVTADVPGPPQYRHVLCVDSTAGNDDSICRNGGTASQPTRHCCATLNMALQAAIEKGNSTVIYLQPGNYSLTSNYTYTNYDTFGLIGNASTSDQVIVQCHAKETGLAFINSADVTLRLLTMHNCGAKQNSTNRNIFKPDALTNYSTIDIHAAVYMSFCRHITISDVTWTSTKGISLALYNTVGTVTITNCVFSHSTQHEHHNFGGGGGIMIEFSYCRPGSKDCDKADETQISTEWSSGAKYVIADTMFLENTVFRYSADRYKAKLYKFSNTKSNSYNLGNGAGLALILKGEANRNQFQIDNCMFSNNWAHYGGGFYIAFLDSSYNNYVSITHCKITGNVNYDAWISSKWDIDATGGGGMVFFASGINGINTLDISNSTFEENMGVSGGGLSIQAASNFKTLNGSVVLRDLTFLNNTAFLGSAIYLFQDNYFNERLNVTLADSNFTENLPMCFRYSTRSLASLPCFGIVYSSGQVVSLVGHLEFIGNSAACLEIHYTSFIVTNGTSLVFVNNTNDEGGAIALYDCSFIQIWPYTSFWFESNHATERGGAIYSGDCLSGYAQSAVLSSYCFLSYYDIMIHPDNWKTNFTFINNTDDENNSTIYSESLTSCWWPEINNTFEVTLNKTLCWTPFDYSGVNCIHEVYAGPAYMNFSSVDDIGHIVQKPGESLPFPDVIDGLGHHSINTKITAHIQSDTVGSFSKGCTDEHDISVNKSTRLYYCPKDCNSGYVNAGSRSQINMISSGMLQATIVIDFDNCTWPYGLDPTCSYCELSIPVFCCGDEQVCSGNEFCEIESFISPKLCYCVSPVTHIASDNTTDIDYIVGQCPLSYSNISYSFTYKSLQKHSSEGHHFCNSSRSGMLCGQCSKGYSIPVNSIYFKCVNCTTDMIYKGWAQLIFLQFLPLTVLVLAIVVLNVNLNVGIMSGFMLYCQLLTVQFPGWYYPAWLALNDGTHVGNDPIPFYVDSLYSCLNLNFLNFFLDWDQAVCLTKDMTALGAISFWYIVAFYPLLLIALMSLWLILYDRGVRFTIGVTIPLHKCLARFWRCFKIEPSLVHSLGSVYVLCLMQLLAVSLKLMHYSTWYSLFDEHRSGHSFHYDANLVYFGWPHAFFGLFALTVLFFVLFLPTVFLLFFQFSWFHRILELFRIRYQGLMMIGDIFTGHFKDGSTNRVDFRSFAGLYILFRAVALACILYMSYSNNILYSEIALSLLFAAIIMIFRPFKGTLVNFFEFFFFFVLGIMSGLCLAFQADGRNACIYAIMHLPLLLIVLYLSVKYSKRCYEYCMTVSAKKKKQQELLTDGEDSEYLSSEEVPDRVLNPGHYQERHVAFSSPPEEGGEHRNVRLLSLASERETTARTEFIPSFRSTIRNTDSDYGSSNNN